MKTIRSGLSSVLALAALAGLIVLLVGLFSTANSSSVGPNTSPVATLASQVSPLATPNVPLARIGAPLAMQSTGRLGPILGGQSSHLGIIKKDNKEYLATFDPATGQERKLLDQNPWWPRLSGRWLAYTDLSAPGAATYYSRIKVLDINTGQKIDLGKGDAIQTIPDISGDTVVWVDGRNVAQAGPDISAYDLAVNKETPVAGGPGYRTFPKISGKWIIYLQYIGEPLKSREVKAAELRAHSLQTGEDFGIGPTPYTQDSFFGTYHAIDGDKVAWTKFNAGTYSGELHLYDLKTRTDRQLTEPHNLGPALLSISAQAGLVAYNDPGLWIIIDYLQPIPAVVPFTPSMESLGGYQLVGNYLIAQTSVKRSAFEERTYETFVMKITR